jgi:Kef-type K+ transport system membrane component KefB
VPESGFVNLLIICAVAFAAPLALGVAPRLRLPAVVLEIVAGIVIGPSVLGWVTIDEPVRVLATVGLAFLLFLAGLEVDPDALRGRVLRLTVFGFLLSVAVAFAVGFMLSAVGLVDSPVLIAIILTATSLGVVVPVLKDAGEIATPFGQLVIAAASIADFGAIILLSVFFSRDGAGVGAQLVIIGLFAAAVLTAAMTLSGVQHVGRISDLLVRLQDTTAQIRVRGAFLMLIGLVALADELGLEVILGAFAAGMILAILDRDTMRTHPQLHLKLDGIGYGVFIPVFFVASGVRFDLNALFSSTSTVAMIPIFLAALLAARGLPAVAYRTAIDRRRVVVAGILQATSLPFIVAASAIGLQLGAITASTAAALLAAGLLSVLIFPVLGLTILRRDGKAGPAPAVAEVATPAPGPAGH